LLPSLPNAGRWSAATSSFAIPTAQAHDSTRCGEPTHRDRGPVGAEHGPHPQPGPGDLGCELERIVTPVGVQGRLVRQRGDRDRPLLPEQQDVLGARGDRGETASEHPGVDLPLRGTPRPGCQRSEGHTRRGARGVSLRRRCETSPRLSTGRQPSMKQEPCSRGQGIPALQGREKSNEDHDQGECGADHSRSRQQDVQVSGTD